MAEVFRNARQPVGTAPTPAYTCPAATRAVVIGCQVANVDGVNAADLSLAWTDASAGDAVTHLCRTVPVPPDAAFSPISGRLVLEAGDRLEASASAAGDLELSLSVLELS